MTDTQAQTLTHQQIDEMPAGREIDTLIAEMVMGLDGNSVAWTAGIPPRPCYPRYSEDKLISVDIINKLSHLWPSLSIEHNSWDGGKKSDWLVSEKDSYSRDQDGSCLKANGNTLQLALCRALLKASNPKC